MGELSGSWHPRPELRRGVFRQPAAREASSHPTRVAHQRGQPRWSTSRSVVRADLLGLLRLDGDPQTGQMTHSVSEPSVYVVIFASSCRRTSGAAEPGGPQPRSGGIGVAVSARTLVPPIRKLSARRTEAVTEGLATERVGSGAELRSIRDLRGVSSWGDQREAGADAWPGARWSWDDGKGPFRYRHTRSRPGPSRAMRKTSVVPAARASRAASPTPRPTGTPRSSR